MLARVANRVGRARSIDEVWIATTDGVSDEPIVEECRRWQVPVFRGDEHDVLDRYRGAARAAQADIVVRITSDCPLIEPEVTDRTVRAFLAEGPEYASNTLVRTYPRGLDTEVMTMQTLERAWREADQAYQREHVTPYIYEHPERFKLLSVTSDGDFSQHRWTVDNLEDLEFVRAVYQRLEKQPEFDWQDVLALLEREPDLIEINRSVPQKALHAG